MIVIEFIIIVPYIKRLIPFHLKICNTFLFHTFPMMYNIILVTCRRFATWTVAKLSRDTNSIILQGPVCSGNRVTGWHINESNGLSKRFHAEMPGFAFNSTILWDPKKWHRPTLEPIRQLETVKEEFRVRISSSPVVL